MRIDDKINSVSGPEFQRPDKVKDKSVPGAEQIPSKDQVTVSERAKEIAKVQSDVNKIPDVRADRVDEVKKAITSGTYNIKGEAVAEKMLREAVIDSLV